MISKIGPHLGSFGDLMRYIPECEGQVVQMFTSVPLSLKKPERWRLERLLDLATKKKVKVLFHGPMTTNFVRRENQDTVNATVEYVQGLSEVLQGRRIVFHTGKPEKDGVFEEQFAFMRSVLQRCVPFLEASKNMVCLEPVS